MRILKSSWLQILVHIAALVPLAWLVWDFTQGHLTANPIREIQLRTGKSTLTLLVLTLACRPIYTIFGLKQALQLRRLLGLYTFGYASLHFLNFVGVDYEFNFALIWADIANKRFVIVGFITFLILLALAVTSTGEWERRLGKNWTRLHRLIYAAALLAALHFIWQTKADFRVPFIYSGVVVLLLILRIPRIAKVVRIGGKWLKREQGGQGMVDEI
ncbi:MAG: protein-methionine-sulfoxide reductase heme-binding subunit MsrQ [Chloroflexota bacterium]|nr:protein-methionine-sulfoxide reductase heme-binding subunit MsrQ [Chloroflexota bacterium]